MAALQYLQHFNYLHKIYTKNLSTFTFKQYKLNLNKMKKIFLLATAGLLIASASFADGGKKKKCAKGKSCCSKDKTVKSCSMDKENKTAKM